MSWNSSQCLLLPSAIIALRSSPSANLIESSKKTQQKRHIFVWKRLISEENKRQSVSCGRRNRNNDPCGINLNKRKTNLLNSARISIELNVEHIRTTCFLTIQMLKCVFLLSPNSEILGENQLGKNWYRSKSLAVRNNINKASQMLFVFPLVHVCVWVQLYISYSFLL